MNLSRKTMWAAAFAITGVMPSHAAEPRLPRDGWVGWQIPAVDGAPAWCCYGNWQDATPSTCDLDTDRGYGAREKGVTTDAVKVYVRSAGGKIDRVRVLAASCPVQSRTPVQPLADVSTDDSARWLTTLAKREGTDAVTGEPITRDALAALAMHPGALARDAMSEFARNSASADTRKWSVFWLALARGADGADVVRDVMFNDQVAEVREHAAFAMSQSRSPRKAQDLIRLGNTDREGGVRAKAWFWLAQTGAEDAEQAIVAALRKDADDDVREQGVFALSQLPDERATRALISVAEDRGLSAEQRKRAIFWLAQSKSDSAQDYLDKVLAKR
jgi:hypothetical protein